MTHNLTTELLLPLPMDQAFSFFADAGNLETITPPELKFKILTPTPVQMETGTLIDYRLQLAAIPFNWRTLISVWDPPYRFIDEQLKGPYRSWVHEHLFKEVDHGTLMTDRVQYQLPFWPFGEMVSPLVHHQLQKIFRFRSRTIQELMTNQNPTCPDGK